MTDSTAQPRAAEPSRPAELLAPRPTARTLRRRTSLPVQAGRFVAINLRMMKMVRRSHQH